MNSFLNIVKESFAVEIIWILLGITLGKLLDIFLKFIKVRKAKYSLRKRLSTDSEFSIDNLSILSLDHADPTYELHDIILNSSNKRLYIDCPSDLKDTFQRFDYNFTFEKDSSFNRESDFEDIASITGISNISELIEVHKCKVAKEFIDKLNKGQTLFNGKKYGVYQIHRKRVAGKDEEAAIHLSLFETDYFTHCVFQSIYHELKKQGHPIGKVEKMEELQKYTPFLTSFGMNTLVLIETHKGEEVILAKRSKYLGILEGKSKWHVSMNEGLTETDKEGKDVSLIKCLHRGLREELGIREEHHKNIDDEKFMDLFLEKNNFEIGLTSFVKMDTTYNKLKEVYSVAKDAELETDAIISVPLQKQEMNRFLRSNNLTSACKYTLKMYTTRQKYLW